MIGVPRSLLVPKLVLLLSIGVVPVWAQATDPALRVEVIRTGYGVPHIYADDFEALGYAMGYLQLEDYGDRVPLQLMRVRGEMALHEGREWLESDFENRVSFLGAVQIYDRIDPDARDVYEGFATGVNRYVEEHPEEFPGWMASDFTGYDVAALYVYRPGANQIRQWVRRLGGDVGAVVPGEVDDPAGSDVGSSAWALSGDRTNSGFPILMRNPHLGWNAGYWEVHVVVPGELDFYGDFRIGAPLGIVGGFNRDLGFATTNNQVEDTEVYALERDPADADRYLLDGASHRIDREAITLPYRDQNTVREATRERATTRFGPVIHSDARFIYVLRTPVDGEFRVGMQFLRMMRARDLDEWMLAMDMRAHPESNFIYADREGNILYLWNAALPVRPHPPGNGQPVHVTSSSEIWSELHGLDDLPQLLNPPGGYVRNENDGPWWTNLNEVLDPSDFPDYLAAGEETTLSLRSQHSLFLLDSKQRMSLDDVVELKHSDRMLLADRVKDDLTRAVRAAAASGGMDGTDLPLVPALLLLERWDNRVAADSRGALLFAEWWGMYEQVTSVTTRFREPWSPDLPVQTPRGLQDPELAARLFPRAVEETIRRYGGWDIAWGEAHRVRRGRVDLPASGCPGALGCFRVLGFDTDPDGVGRASRGDGWVLAVEFTDPPRAYSVLAYGQSDREDSPHFDDQAPLFAKGEMKPVRYERVDVEAGALRRYRPGLE